MVRNISILAAAFVAICATSGFAKSAKPRTPVLTRPPAFELSRFYIGAKEGVVWSTRRDAFPREARFANDLVSSAFVDEPVRPHYAGLSRGIVVDRDLTSAFEDTSFGQANSSDLRNLGDLTSVTSGKAASSAPDLEKRLMKIGADQFTDDQLPRQHFVRNPSVGIEIQPSGFTHGELASIPGPNANRRPTAFDASEGTLLDPLLNTTYDLNFPKTVPSLK
jgi:hypothetical protein